VKVAILDAAEKDLIMAVLDCRRNPSWIRQRLMSE
jgi:hypothetical protein